MVTGKKNARMCGCAGQSLQAGLARKGGAFFADDASPDGVAGQGEFIFHLPGQSFIAQVFPVAVTAQDARQQAIAAVDDPLALISNEIAEWERERRFARKLQVDRGNRLVSEIRPVGCHFISLEFAKILRGSGKDEGVEAFTIDEDLIGAGFNSANAMPAANLCAMGK